MVNHVFKLIQCHFLPHASSDILILFTSSKFGFFRYEILIENLMDPAHVPYAHYRIIQAPPAFKNRYLCQFYLLNSYV